jgi:hypothetical protein
LLQDIDCPGFVDLQTAVDQDIDQFRKHVFFGIRREIFIEKIIFKNLIQSHVLHLTL